MIQKSSIADWTRNRPAKSIRGLEFVKSNPSVFGQNAVGEIRSVIFLDRLPERTRARMDISESRDGRVQACLTRDRHTLYIGAEGGINAGSVCEHLFDGLASVEQILFENSSLRTDEADSFAQMFRGCESLESLDVNGFVTLKAYDFTEMFRGCRRLKQLGISRFRIDLAIRWAKYFDERCDSVWFRVPPHISEMFHDCESLEALDLRSFNTCDVRRFDGLFENCRSLRTLQLGGAFGVRGDARTDRMFAGCENLDKKSLPVRLSPRQAEAAGL